MIGRESPGSGLEAFLQSQACLAFLEIKQGKKPYSVWGGFLFCRAPGICAES